MTVPTPAALYTQGFATRAENVEIPHYDTRVPNPMDVRYPLGKRWINTTANAEYSLTSFSSAGGTLAATWTLLSSSTVAAAVTGLTGDDAVEVLPGPDGVINVIGGSGILTQGNPSAHQLIIFNTAPGSSWNNTTADRPLLSGQSYLCTGGGTLSLSLPSASVFGDTIEVLLDGSTGFIITQTSGQQIRIGRSTTTLGSGGSLASTFQGDGFIAVCKVANTLWTVTDVTGNLTVV